LAPQKVAAVGERNALKGGLGEPWQLLVGAASMAAQHLFDLALDRLDGD